MRRRLAKITVMSLLTIVTLCAVAVGAFFWRLSEGPVSLDFMRGMVQSEINKNLPGLEVKLDGVLIERDAKTRLPSFRLRNLELLDTDGNTIARAPRAAVSVDEGSLLTGRITPRQLDLIGPRIMIKRSITGGFVMGFGRPSGDDEAEVNASGKSNHGEFSEAILPETSGADVIDILSKPLPADGEAGSTISSLDFIKISDAAITLFDESNDAYWNAPNADLAFKRMPYGFAVVANASIQSEDKPIRTEISASYRRETKSFSISASIYDFVPSDASKKVFALSQLARANVPLSGHAELEMTEAGQITKGSAEFSVAAGQLLLPEFIAEPIAIDEGSIRLDYDPATGGVAIVDSSVLSGRSRANLTGRIDPVRSQAGVLEALTIAIAANNTGLDPAGGKSDESPPIDRVEFRGLASVVKARLDVDDLVVMSGNSGIRLRGVFTGGARSPGINLAGRARNMSAALVKKLWPPIVAPNTRLWVNQNIKAGQITDGEMFIRLAENQLAITKETKVLPEGSLTLKLTLDGVSTSYFRELPLISSASGQATLDSNSFSLKLDEGALTMPSGRNVKLAGGTMVITDLLKPVSPAEFHIDALASVPSVFEFMGLPDLNLLKSAGFDIGKLSGDADVDLMLSIPFMKNLPRDLVQVTAKAKITGASLKNAIEGIDLTDGSMNVAVTSGSIKGEGPVKLNGIPAKLTWQRTTGEKSVQSATIETELDDKQRDKIGAKVSGFLTGPVKVKVTIPEIGEPGTGIEVDADLARATMQIEAIDWVREPRKGTRATFKYAKSDTGATIDDLEISGPDVSLKGTVKLGKNGAFAEAKLPSVVLSDENQFGITLKKTGDGMAVAINGQSFDARPLIKSMFGKSGGAIGSGEGDDPITYLVTTQVDRVYAHRGEIIAGLNGNLVTRGGAVLSANLQGVFLSGHPISMRIQPANGGREFIIAGRDGGAALRAANLYSKVAGGQIEFNAQMGQGSVRTGQLIIRNFEVRNEAALAELDRRGKPKQTGPRRDSIPFRRLRLPFTADQRFLRIDDAEVIGDQICATADGIIRKADSAIDIDGTIIPACGLNNIPGKIPVVGLLFGEGLFALTYALSGNISSPKFQFNPISAVAPGILRKFFEFGNVSPTRKSTDKGTKSD